MQVTHGNEEVVFSRPYRVQLPKPVYTQWAQEGASHQCQPLNPDLLLRQPCQCVSCRVGSMTKLAVKGGDVSVQRECSGLTQGVRYTSVDSRGSCMWNLS